MTRCEDTSDENFKIKTQLFEANPNAMFSSIKAQMRESLILDPPYAECLQLSKKIGVNKILFPELDPVYTPLILFKVAYCGFLELGFFTVGSNNPKNMPGSRLRLFSLLNEKKPTYRSISKLFDPRFFVG